MTNHVFVYGTLKRRSSANHLLEGCRFEGTARLSARIYSLGGFPGIKLDPKAETFGEVYELPADPEQRSMVLARLDRYEGVPSLYSRVETEASVIGVAKPYPVFTYEYNHRVSEDMRINAGVW